MDATILFTENNPPSPDESNNVTGAYVYQVDGVLFHCLATVALSLFSLPERAAYPHQSARRRRQSDNHSKAKE